MIERLKLIFNGLLFIVISYPICNVRCKRCVFLSYVFCSTYIQYILTRIYVWLVLPTVYRVRVEFLLQPRLERERERERTSEVRNKHFERHYGWELRRHSALSSFSFRLNAQEVSYLCLLRICEVRIEMVNITRIQILGNFSPSVLRNRKRRKITSTCDE